MPAEFLRIMTVPIGALLLCTRDERLSGIVIHPDRAAMTAGNAVVNAVDRSASPIMHQAVREMDEYFAGRRRDFELPLDLSECPPFTQRILELLRTVPYGETVTYGDLAERAGSPRAARAVGRAVAGNPLPIVIPCHRVVAAGRRLGGYSGGGGVRTKAWLLTLERSNCRGNQADFQEKSLDSRHGHLLNRGPHFG